MVAFPQGWHEAESCLLSPFRRVAGGHRLLAKKGKEIFGNWTVDIRKMVVGTNLGRP